ncbi:hypothetical protein HanPSC8_Chr08g0336641 [Helianthus annuus]|nr:hypothetical protein HanPSC8_Chr08g0336641 [Helianthus annuus]
MNNVSRCFKTPRHEQCLQIKHHDLNHSHVNVSRCLKHHAMNNVSRCFKTPHHEQCLQIKHHDLNHSHGVLKSGNVLY